MFLVLLVVLVEVEKVGGEGGCVFGFVGGLGVGFEIGGGCVFGFGGGLGGG